MSFLKFLEEENKKLRHYEHRALDDAGRVIEHAADLGKREYHNIRENLSYFSHNVRPKTLIPYFENNLPNWVSDGEQVAGIWNKYIDPGIHMLEGIDHQPTVPPPWWFEGSDKSPTKVDPGKQNGHDFY